MPAENPLQAFEPVRYAKDELSPLLVSLVELTAEENRADQNVFFSSILNGVDRAQHTDDLADPFMQLSMSAFRGFQFSPHAAILLDLVLEKAQALSEVLSAEPEEIN